MIISVKKTLNNAGHIDAKLIDFGEIRQKIPTKLAAFHWLFLGEVCPRNFPWNRPILPLKIPRNLTFFSATYQKPWLFLRNTITLLDSVRCSWFCNSFHRYMGELSSPCRADPGFFLGGDAPQRNGVTDWWRKLIILNCWEYISRDSISTDGRRNASATLFIEVGYFVPERRGI